MKGRRVLVTAGANGIGLSIAEQFVACGAKVHVCDVDHEALSRLSSDKITGSHCDVSNRASVESLVHAVQEQLGGIDVLVNNAGIAGPAGPVDEVDPQEWDRTFDVNVGGYFNVVRKMIGLMDGERQSAIINISSSAGRLGFPFRSPYASSKWAVVGLTKALSLELAPRGIRVNAVLPGAVDGPRLQRVIEMQAEENRISREEMLSKVVSQVGQKRLISPTEIATVVVFLASEASSAISGQAIAVDGDLQSMF
ncbi:SDR family oxidoreductase [Rhizobium sp. Root149]|uniref:SDR family oxidoreductase n=1 Tax=Rhizobium sp. Root149 TaxID=1736473 RepID=UPI001FCD8DE3|nr:SDR family oxidoreductase [Rhizobium sp. Root149]